MGSERGIRDRCQPKEPNYSAALQAIGPAAIKLGQTLATRPDVIGEAAARDLLQLQDSLPPVPFGQILDEIELSLGKSLDELSSHISVVSTPHTPPPTHPM